MIELLILFELNKRTLTMYGVSKEIKNSFSVMTTPSYGTIKPALERLKKNGFVKAQKTISQGGRPSNYYSITEDGIKELKRLIILPPVDNPIQILHLHFSSNLHYPTALIRLNKKVLPFPSTYRLFSYKNNRQ